MVDTPYYGILTLANQQKISEIQNGMAPRGPGRPPNADAAAAEESSELEDPVFLLERERHVDKHIYSYNLFYISGQKV